MGYLGVTGFSDNAASKFHDALQAGPEGRPEGVRRRSPWQPGGLRERRPRDRQRVHRRRAALLGAGRGREPDGDDRDRSGLATADDIKVTCSVDKGRRLGERDRGRRAPGPEAGDDRRRDVVREGHRPAVDPAQDGSALKLTIAKWLTPDKRGIHHVGIVPDVAVPTPASPVPPADGQDPVLEQGGPAADDRLDRVGAAPGGLARARGRPAVALCASGARPPLRTPGDARRPVLADRPSKAVPPTGVTD